jgi:hypothetical protein
MNLCLLEGSKKSSLVAGDAMLGVRVSRRFIALFQGIACFYNIIELQGSNTGQIPAIATRMVASEPPHRLEWYKHTFLGIFPAICLVPRCCVSCSNTHQWCREKSRIKLACSPPFGDACYGDDAWGEIPTSEGVCMANWSSTMDNVSASAVAELGELNLQAHTACTALTTKVCSKCSS